MLPTQTGHSQLGSAGVMSSLTKNDVIGEEALRKETWVG